MIWTDERKQKAIDSCYKWRGTKHRDHLALPGKGVDCINFVCAVAKEAGIVEEFKMPRYNVNLSRRGASDILINSVSSVSSVEKIEDINTAQFGDIAVFKSHYCCNHVGIVIEEHGIQYLWHVRSGSFVEPFPYQCEKKFVLCLLRFKDLGLTADPSKLNV